MLSRLTRLALLAAVPVACSSSPASSGGALTGPTVSMRFARASFWDAPFPSDDLVKDDGTIDVSGFPNLPAPDTVAIVEQCRALLAGNAHGFAQAGGIFFTTSDAIDPSRLPDLATSVTAASPAFLVSVTQGAPDYMKRYPVTVRFEADGGPFGAPNMVTMVPLQGVPLREKTTYAAVLTRDLGLAPSAEMASIASGTKPDAMPQHAFEEYGAALSALAGAGVDASQIAGMTVFTTDAPTGALGLVLKDMLAHPLPQPESPFKQTDLFPDYCVYASTLEMPDYQAGSPPYDFQSTGGAWAFDASGNPVQQRTEKAGVVVTIPRAPMPPGGWPIVHFIRTGGGGDRPLVDRGPQATNGGPPITPGTGPALWFAKAGIAGASVDGPHEDLRNLTGDNEDFLMFNINNVPALRDNVRESAAEYALFAHVLASLTLDVSDCPGTTSPAKFDGSKIGLMGHSMGATIAPLSLAVEPAYRAVVLSGAGASWIENIIWKQQPLKVRPVVDLLLRYNTLDPPRDVTEDDPVLTLFQWAAEPADTQLYTRSILVEPPAGQAPRPVLMEQGIVDHYIMPPIANATSLSLGLDLAGTPLDATSQELTGDGAPTLESVLAYSGRSQIALPASGNRGGVTAVVVQHPADGIEDGHEIVFQTDPPKREYRCFLQAWAAGQVPLVPQSGDVNGPCQ